MRIRTQFIITIILFGVVLIGIAISVMLTSQQVEKSSQQEHLASSIAQGASELSYLSNDYLIYRENQQMTRWQIRFSSFSNQVNALQGDNPEQQALIRNIQSNSQRLKAVFDSMSMPQIPGETLDLAFLQVSWSRMAVQSQSLVSDATNLSQLFHDQTEQIRRLNNMIIIMMLIIFILFMVASSLIMFQRTLRSIGHLSTGAAIIGAGNLDYKLEEFKNDEVGDLSRTFNRMTDNLKAIIALKVDLEREIIERKQIDIIKDEFIGMVSHELKTPLTVIIGALSVANEESLTSEQKRDLFNDAVISAYALAGIVDNLLELSRFQSNRLTLQLSSTDFHSIAQRVINNLQNLSPVHKIIAEISYDSPHILVDPLRMELVLKNLIENAIKYSPKGGEVRVFTRQQDGQLIVSINDQGLGISPENQAKLFQSFERVDAYEKYTIPGLGLGLRVCRILVEAHGGRIWLESELDKGTTFFFSIPITKA